MAFSHPALMQAMLALASLQMARLEGVPSTASMKHYHLSLRRIAKNYNNPNRRAQPATLAASLLLGFYEVWNSDHDKWCKHMWGARAVIREVPLQRMTRDLLAIKRKRARMLHEESVRQQDDGFYYELPEHDIDWMEGDMDRMDTDFISELTGRVVNYGDAGLVREMDQVPPPRTYTRRDIETYQHTVDLFWWYCKQDVYQSFLGGTRLLYVTSSLQYLFPPSESSLID